MCGCVAVLINSVLLNLLCLDLMLGWVQQTGRVLEQGVRLDADYTTLLLLCICLNLAFDIRNNIKQHLKSPLDFAMTFVKSLVKVNKQRSQLVLERHHTNTATGT